MLKKIVILAVFIMGFSMLAGCNYVCRGGPNDCYGAADCWYARHNCTSC